MPQDLTEKKLMEKYNKNDIFEKELSEVMKMDGLQQCGVKKGPEKIKNEPLLASPKTSQHPKVMLCLVDWMVTSFFCKIRQVLPRIDQLVNFYLL